MDIQPLNKATCYCKSGSFQWVHGKKLSSLRNCSSTSTRSVLSLYTCTYKVFQIKVSISLIWLGHKYRPRIYIIFYRWFQISMEIPSIEDTDRLQTNITQVFRRATVSNMLFNGDKFQLLRYKRSEEIKSTEYRTEINTLLGVVV